MGEGTEMVTLINTLIQNKPGELVIILVVVVSTFNAVSVALVRVIPYAWNIYTGKIKENNKNRDATRKKIDEVHQQVIRMNGSIAAHHADMNIHYKNDNFITIDKCHESHKELSENMRKDIKDMADGIYDRINKNTELLHELKGTIDHQQKSDGRQ